MFVVAEGFLSNLIKDYDNHLVSTEVVVVRGGILIKPVNF
jgi:hypothetical protein